MDNNKTSKVLIIIKYVRAFSLKYSTIEYNKKRLIKEINSAFPITLFKNFDIKKALKNLTILKKYETPNKST